MSVSSRAAGNFSFVRKSAVDRLYCRPAGLQSDVEQHLVPSSVTVLNMLSVRVVTDRVTIDQRHRSREIFANMRRR